MNHIHCVHDNTTTISDIKYITSDIASTVSVSSNPLYWWYQIYCMYDIAGTVCDCQEPPREIPPMTRSCGRKLLSKASGLNGLPRLSRASTPKPESVCFTISWLSPTPLTLTGGYPRPPFSGENQLRAIANKSPGHERNISNQTPSVSIIAFLAGISRLLQLCIWLFTSSQLWEAWKA